MPGGISKRAIAYLPGKHDRAATVQPLTTQTTQPRPEDVYLCGGIWAARVMQILVRRYGRRSSRRSESWPCPAAGRLLGRGPHGWRSGRFSGDRGRVGGLSAAPSREHNVQDMKRAVSSGLLSWATSRTSNSGIPNSCSWSTQAAGGPSAGRLAARAGPRTHGPVHQRAGMPRQSAGGARRHQRA